MDVLIWWLLVELIGLGAFPIAFRFFRNLPDRGYAFTKPLGLLLVAYPFWLLTNYGFLINTQGVIAMVALLVALVAWTLFGRSPSEIAVNDEHSEVETTKQVEGGSSPESLSAGHVHEQAPLAWLREHHMLVLINEAVFTLAFLFWVFVRAYMPEITATEKPMEFAFLNGILQSRSFPPLDPWLSGYGISYYHFGYVIVAMLTLLSGISSSITFNLAIALLFGLAASGAFGLAYNLIQGQFPSSFRSSSRSMLYSLLAPVFLVVVGNLEGFFEVLHTRGLGSPEFWQWLDIKGLTEAPVNGAFVPTDNWWWWRASRVIHDVARGQTQEVIDEFPQFSFLLGDMHPHVLALPFVLLTLAVALNILRSKTLPSLESPLTVPNDSRPLATRLASYVFLLFPSIPWLLLISLVVGSLPFLNFWDVLPYGFIVIAAFTIARYRQTNHWERTATRDVAFFTVLLGIASVLLYLPFFVGFQSQAGGLLPVLFVKTQLHQYLIVFGLFVFIFLAFLARSLYQYRDNLRSAILQAIPFAALVIGFPLAIALLAVILLSVSPALQDSARAAFPESPNTLLPNVLNAYFGPLLADPWLYLILGLVLVTILLLLRFRVVNMAVADTSKTFVLLLILTGFLLTFSVEFVYLRDVFGTRMNTVFKFYFQTWTLFSVAAAFAVFYLSDKLIGLVRGLFLAGLGTLMAASLIYPALGIPNRAEDFAKQPTLDGTAWIQSANPSDYAAIHWLKDNAPRGSKILEATGRQYSYDDRISMATGLPTVLGWIGHEDQWRGGSKLFKNDAAGIDRAADVARIYQTTNPQESLTLLDKYAINFVVVGQTETSVYNLNKGQIDKFARVLTLVFQDGDSRIYARSN